MTQSFLLGCQDPPRGRRSYIPRPTCAPARVTGGQHEEGLLEADTGSRRGRVFCQGQEQPQAAPGLACSPRVCPHGCSVGAWPRSPAQWGGRCAGLVAGATQMAQEGKE